MESKNEINQEKHLDLNDIIRITIDNKLKIFLISFFITSLVVLFYYFYNYKPRSEKLIIEQEINYATDEVHNLRLINASINQLYDNEFLDKIIQHISIFYSPIFDEPGQGQEELLTSISIQNIETDSINFVSDDFFRSVFIGFFKNNPNEYLEKFNKTLDYNFAEPSFELRFIPKKDYLTQFASIKIHFANNLNIADNRKYLDIVFSNLQIHINKKLNNIINNANKNYVRKVNQVLELINNFNELLYSNYSDSIDNKIQLLKEESEIAAKLAKKEIDNKIYFLNLTKEESEIAAKLAKKEMDILNNLIEKEIDILSNRAEQNPVFLDLSNSVLNLYQIADILGGTEISQYKAKKFTERIVLEAKKAAELNAEKIKIQIQNLLHKKKSKDYILQLKSNNKFYDIVESEFFKKRIVDDLKASGIYDITDKKIFVLGRSKEIREFENNFYLYFASFFVAVYLLCSLIFVIFFVLQYIHKEKIN